MNSTTIREPNNFGKPKAVHSITMTRNGKSRHFKVNPTIFVAVIGLIVVLMSGYIASTAYLVFRDDLVSGHFARQARMKHEYEDRIAALRSKLDQVTSRQLLDQQAIEARVNELMKRQQTIGVQSSSLGKLFDKAQLKGIDVINSASGIPVPAQNPLKDDDVDRSLTTGSILVPSNESGSKQFASAFSLRGSHINASSLNKQNKAIETPTYSDEMFVEIAEAIETIDVGQKKKIDVIRLTADQRAQTITQTLENLGIKVPTPDNTAQGGPFVPLDQSMEFDTYLDALEQSIDYFDKTSKMAKALPLGMPVKNPKISSRFGTRVDPFNGRTAMHSGIDFRAKRGTKVYATGMGKVIHAGRKGGYGNAVEIRHNNGLISRYAHLSRISVKKGQFVDTNTTIGRVGSTGRSTGPHLHYEIRRGKSARNPSKYISAGEKIKDLI